jgi:putative transcriptional regulator
MQIRSGSLLIANPAYADQEQQGHVVYITESTKYSTMGVVLNSSNSYDLGDLLIQKDIDWPYETYVGVGGAFSPSCLIMLHTNDWYSSNTMPVTNDLSISSDAVMLEKLEMGNTPDWYRMFMGTSGWSPQELNQELKGKNPKWLLLAKPSQRVIRTETSNIWDIAVGELSKDVFSSYI